MSAPIIALTTYGRHENNFRTKNYDEWFAIPTRYVDAVRRAGGVPLMLPPGEKNLAAVLENVDAVIFIGGGDIDPDRYGGNSTHPNVARVDPERDESELALLKTLAFDEQLPTLCICRGLQVANVALGGTLHEHVPDVVGEDIHRGSDTGWTMHPLEADSGSRLAEIMGATTVATYSGHHQGIKDLADDLRVTGTAADGIIEAVDMPGHPWFIAVQWHPEVSAAEDPTQQRLFDALVQAVKENKSAAGDSR